MKKKLLFIPIGMFLLAVIYVPLRRYEWVELPCRNTEYRVYRSLATGACGSELKENGATDFFGEHWVYAESDGSQFVHFFGKTFFWTDVVPSELQAYPEANLEISVKRLAQSDSVTTYTVTGQGVDITFTDVGNKIVLAR